ncbi:MAG: hypothetical protein LBD84_01955 [Campylobacteraceae bacterium]|jgi:hypothetical protein|nr:hypothetical protein [Campylobacteraceae bacterium]
MAAVLMNKFKTLSLSKLKVLFLSLFLGFFLVGCGGAQTPEITTQPKSKVATANSEATLQVVANVQDNGTLLYQWYTNTENSNKGGTAIEGANSDVFTFTVPSEGFAYYYVVVTNLHADSTTYASATSDVAVIEVVNYEVNEVLFYDEDLKLLNVETVKNGETIVLDDNSWFPLNSQTAVNELTISADTALFAVANVVGIKERAQLEAIKNNLDGKYVLEADIDLSGSSWTPLGSEANPFTGRLSGSIKLYKIKGLNVSGANYSGLFGYVKGGHIVALRLEVGNSGISGGDYVGGIAGYVNLGTITAVTVSGGDIKGGKYVGAIAGNVKIGTITATTSTNNVVATGDYVGGVVGSINLGTITATYTKGDISTSGSYIGGIAGSSDLSTITATFGYGDIKGDKYVGGVAGYARFSTVTASFLYGKVSGNSKVGKVVGDKSLSLIVFSTSSSLFL